MHHSQLTSFSRTINDIVKFKDKDVGQACNRLLRYPETAV